MSSLAAARAGGSCSAPAPSTECVLGLLDAIRLPRDGPLSFGDAGRWDSGRNGCSCRVSRAASTLL